MSQQSKYEPTSEIRSIQWSVLKRTGASIALVAYLIVVLLGPIPSTEHLTRPMSEAIRPVHESMYLGHGYRFFAPNPGPSHIVVYEVTTSTGEVITGTFPDRDKHWPRLRYHRWFMLSETIYSEYSSTEDAKAHQERLVEMDQQIAELRNVAPGRAVLERLVRQREEMVEAYSRATLRIDKMITSLAKELLEQTDGESIKIWSQERGIPFPNQVISGLKLDNPQFLSEPALLKEFTATQLFSESMPLVEGEDE